MIRKIIQRLMRFLFFHLYHSLAWAYDFIAIIVSKGDWFHWGNSLAEFIKPNHRVLEIGIGTGHFQKHLLEKRFEVVGVEESQAMINITQKSVISFPNKKITRADVHNLPFVSANYDRIISIFPSEYIFQKQVLEEIYRNLRPGGQLVVLMGVIFTGKSIIEWVYRLLYLLSGQKINEDIGQKIFNSGMFFRFKDASVITKMLNTRKLIILIAEK